MHEMAIAKNIVSIVEEEFERNVLQSSNIKKVIFKAGKMNKIVPELLSSRFDHLIKGKDYFDGTELIMEEIPVKIKCKECEYITEINKPVFKCKKCDSNRIEIISGDEMYVEEIFLEN